MKKNLRIVSAAAAALLAVAPIAATAMPVNAAANTTVNAGDVNLPSNTTADIKVSADIYGSAASNNQANGAVAGIISASYNGQTYSANLASENNNIILSRTSNPDSEEHFQGQIVPASQVKPGTYSARVKGNVSFNFGSSNANKTVTISLPSNLRANINGTRHIGPATVTTKTNANGVVTLTSVGITNIQVFSVTNVRSVAFYENASGNQVTSGNLTINANSNYMMNVNAVLAAFNDKYQATQLGDKSEKASVTTTAADIIDQLKKQNITVDPLGNFEAPKSFTLTFNAKSQYNNYRASLPVTVTVPNGKEAAAAQEVTKNVTVMHIATIYDKNGKATTEPVLRAYNSVSVVSEPVTINGAKFYKLAGKDQYIKVGNIDGTKRTLKHNSYVYKSNGKAYTHKVGKKTKKVLKKSGEEVTTYGKSFMIHGSQMWRIGKNQYIKVRNF